MSASKASSVEEFNVRVAQVEMNHGVIAVDRDGNILHFCGYVEPATLYDLASLEQELRTDPEFGLVDRNDYVLVPAPKEVMDFYRTL